MPKDPSPLGDEMANTMPEPKFPQPRRGSKSDERARARPGAGEKPDISHRPELPGHPTRMAADIEGQDADPVIDADIGPDLVDAPKSLKKQRG